jgi:transcriptional regulator with XRE-family HTH domain
MHTMDREPNPLLDFFASELHRARSAAGLSQEALGRRIGFSGEMVGKIENGDRRPSDKFAEGCDLVFPDLGGVFTRLLDKAVRSRGVYPAWFAAQLGTADGARPAADCVLRWLAN